MALDLTLLTTRAECDEVLLDIEAELETYQTRDTVQTHADNQAGRSKIKNAALLAEVQAEIDMYTNVLAGPNLTASLRKKNQSKLRKATNRRDDLNDTGAARSGPVRVLAAIDALQVDAQVVVLTDAQTQVLNHRATLSA